jgi:hypothetical protein
MKVLDQDGSPLDAEFDVEATASGADLVLHARYGGRGSQRRSNVDYFPALTLLLARLSAIGAAIDAVAVDSRIALRRPASERLLNLDYPIRLTPATDPNGVRLAITRAQRTVARDPAAAPLGGNNHKRIRISVRLGNSDVDGPALARLLQRGTVGVESVPLGTEYRQAHPNPSVAPADVFTFDPATRERALAAHAMVQNSLADFLHGHGLEPRSPRTGEPDFDLAWVSSRGVFVAEVKSLSGANEDRQLRLGLGQVLHYRHLLQGSRASANAVLAVERPPSSVWQEICKDLDVTLTWPPDWPSLP